MQVPGIRWALLPLLVLFSLITTLKAQFTYSNNGSSVNITGYTGAGGVVVIPGMIDSLPVTAIGFKAFQYKTAVTDITIPNSVTSIEGKAFSNCTGLTRVSMSVNLTVINIGVFEGCNALTSVIIPTSVSSIGRDAFNGCSSLTAVTIGSSVTTIGDSSFSGCEALTSIIIPNSVSRIENLAFRNCSNLTEISLGNHVSVIGDQAFGYCTGLTTVTIPTSVTLIGSGTFLGCTSLSAIATEEMNLNYSSLNGVLFNKSKTELIVYPGGKSGSYSIPETVTTIKDIAFYNCNNLSSVIIGNSVTSIGFQAFSGSTNLASVIIGNGITSFGSEAFFGCTSLANVTIGKNVTYIGGKAFKNCTSLIGATFNGSAPILDWDVFSNTSSGFTVYYYNTGAEFTSPTWNGYKSVNLGAPPIDPGESSYASWGVLQTLPEGHRGPLDRNGPMDLPNSLAYAMGLNPLTATPADLPALGKPDSLSNRVAIRYRRAKNVIDVILTPTTSTTLSGWDPASILNTNVIENGGDWEVVEIEVSAPSGGKLFFQLKAE